MLESHLIFQQGDRHGQVTLVDQHFQGWVAFSYRPNPLPQLVLSDLQGNLCKQLTLIPVATETGQPDNYLANFRIAQTDLPIPLRFHCADIELTGSPCQPKPKLLGFVENIDTQSIHGWAFDLNQPANPIELALKIDGHIIQRFRPNMRRPDIAEHLKLPAESLGIVGFSISPPEILFDGETHTVSVEFSGRDQMLHGSKKPIHFPRSYVSLNKLAPLTRHNRRTKPIARPSTPKVSVIILNRDGAAMLEALFASWQKINSMTAIELIVVDHASEDNSLSVLKRWQQQLPIHVIALPINDSFSASCNRAADAARGENLLFLNNDIVWLQDVLPVMLNTLETNPDIGAVGLKLLKATDDGHLRRQTQVQHLGVRFKLSGPAYWPYETTPDEIEAEYGPQFVPAVTAAVMLCRKNDFFAAGQFDSQYFYGFEDVEFCLRLAHKLDKKLICRNELTALHRHGHTRLSGRAIDIFDRVVSNADILQAHAGIWLKRRYWQSLIAADNNVTTDRLTIGFVIDQAGADASPLQTAALNLAKHILQSQPSAHVVFLTPGHGWYNLRNIHLLIVGHPEYDIRNTSSRREDMIAIAWIRDSAKLWPRLPWWSEFDTYLTATAALKKQLQTKINKPISLSSPALPLGSLLNPQMPPLRVALLIAEPLSSQHQQLVDSLLNALQTDGVIAWCDPFDIAHGSSRVADVRIYTHHGQQLPEIEVKAQPDTLNILWAPTLTQTLNTQPPLPDWQIVTQIPQAAWLHSELEKALGNTFRTS